MKEKNVTGKKIKRSSFSGKLGFVLAAAGSAVGLGNIWRFPYLAAKYGGGIFLLAYILLTATFGYTMIVTETAIGRMTRKSPVGAYAKYGKAAQFKLGGWMNAIIPMLIVPYYSVIGGWVVKYLIEYIGGHTEVLANTEYFGNFITNGQNVELCFLLFSLCAVLIIMAGVENGIEKVSKIMMPMLFILAIIVAAYSVTRPGALAGVKYFLVPDFSHFSWMTIVSAMGQVFYSLSIAMGILVTFGSYMKKKVDIESSTMQIEVFDTGIAILSGLMIIPAVFAFSGDNVHENLQAGASLMFVVLPKVFASMGFGRFAGILFFLLVFFAALTSSIALLESSVSTFVDELHVSRKKSTLIMAGIMIFLGTLSTLGFSTLSNVNIFGMSILDSFDFLTNSIMMPLAAMANCLLVVRVIHIDEIAEEVLKSSKFIKRPVYNFTIKFLAPFSIAIVLFSSIANVLGIIHM